MSETPSMLTRMASAVGNLPPAAKNAGILIAVLVVGGLAGWIGHGQLAGPADVPTMTVHQEWRLLCPALKDKDVSC
ncbi:MAG TPA: hypothetical protein VGC27_12565, partial [Rhizomicrobium sp.]